MYFPKEISYGNEHQTARHDLVNEYTRTYREQR